MSSRTVKLSTNSLSEKNLFCYNHMTKEQTNLRIRFASIEASMTSHTEEGLEKKLAPKYVRTCKACEDPESFVMGRGRSSFDNVYITFASEAYRGPYQNS